MELNINLYDKNGTPQFDDVRQWLEELHRELGDYKKTSSYVRLTRMISALFTIISFNMLSGVYLPRIRKMNEDKGRDITGRSDYDLAKSMEDVSLQTAIALRATNDIHVQVDIMLDIPLQVHRNLWIRQE